jgi:hypothetical protein
MKLDHITIVARSLEEGAEHIGRALGVEMPAGGAHPAMGTHNRLMALGEDCFLELISVDPAAPPPTRPRWFGLDRFDDSPSLATWVLAVDDIEAELSRAHPGSGAATEITRGDLRWHISVADDGTMPLDGAFPTLIEWPQGPHPATGMTDLGCRLHSLDVTHPYAGEIEAFVRSRTGRDRLTVRRGPAKMLTAMIDTPQGLRGLA